MACCGVLPSRGERALDRGKAALEFFVGPPQYRFRIGTQVAREIDGREQQIADFSGGAGLITVQHRLDLVGLFANLVQDRARIVPIEADFARFLLQFERAGEGGERHRHAGERACVLIAFSPAQLSPPP